MDAEGYDGFLVHALRTRVVDGPVTMSAQAFV